MVTNSELDDMSQRIAGVNFVDLPPDNRATVMSLVIQNKQAASIDAINGNLENIETRFSHVSDWFRTSRVYDG
jgi:hypothetical protein